MSLLGSMYMGKFCVANDVIGNGDVIDNGRNGFGCRTVDKFVNGINGNRDLGAVAGEDVIKEYNTKVMVEKYSNNYQNSLRKSWGIQRRLTYGFVGTYAAGMAVVA